MGESDLHKLLKTIGVAYLHNQNCFMVANEVHVSRDRGVERHELDNHYIMDVVGVGLKYVPYMQRGENWSYSDEKYYHHVLRGIEVKVSSSDLKNGFCCTGCNYHYLLTPMRLVNPANLPKWVGLIEYNKYKFKSHFGSQSRFWIEGLRVVKKPRYREIKEYQIKKAVTEIGKRLHWMLIHRIDDELQSN